MVLCGKSFINLINKLRSNIYTDIAYVEWINVAHGMQH